MRTLADAVGVSIRPGSYVAYIAQKGSWRSIKRRKVTSVNVNSGFLILAPLEESYSSGQSGRVLPHNCVVIA